MSSSLSSSNNSQQSGSSRYKFSQNSQNKPRYSQNSNNRHNKNYAQVAQGNVHSGITYAAAPKSQNVLNHIENSTNLAKMDLKMSKMIKNQVNQGIYRNSKFVMTSNTIIGCPVLLKVKSNDTFHGIFVTYSPDFDVLLECCHKIDPDNEVLIYGRSLPKPSQVHARFFERENIVEMTAFEVDKEFALKSKYNLLCKHLNCF